MTGEHGVVPAGLARRTRSVIAPIATVLVRAGVSANAVTVSGFVITISGAAVLALERPASALALLLLGLLADALDGQVARASGGGTKLGAFLDSTFDRLADAALAIAAVVLGTAGDNPVLVVAGFVSLVSSFLVSYVRAKAESLGLGAQVGLAPREARVAIYIAGVALWAISSDGRFFALALIVIATLATLTFITRTQHVITALGKEKS